MRCWFCLILVYTVMLSESWAQETVYAAFRNTGGGGTPSYVSGGSCVNSDVSPITVSYTIPSGALVYAVASSSGDPTAFTITDSASVSLSSTAAIIVDAGGGTRVQRFYEITGGSRSSVSLAFSNGVAAELCLTAYTGVNATPLDKSAGQAEENVTSYTSGNTATLSQANELVLGGYCAHNGTIAVTVGGGMTGRVSSTAGPSCGVGDKTVGATTAVAATGTCSASFGVAFVDTFKFP